MTLVDTNVLLDLVTDDPIWADWFAARLEAAAACGVVSRRKYRRAGVSRTGVFSDFFIGSQAAVQQLPLLTRDIDDFGRISQHSS